MLGGVFWFCSLKYTEGAVSGDRKEVGGTWAKG